MPGQEYYLRDSERMKTIRADYLSHVAAMLKLAGFAEADERAKKIVELERSIAEKHWTLVENDEIKKANNTWSQADFATKAPGLDWAEYFRASGLTKQPTFIVWQPSAFTGESALVESKPLETWKDWLAYHEIEAMAGLLPKALADERFAFFGKSLTGTQSSAPGGSAESRSSTVSWAMRSADLRAKIFSARSEGPRGSDGGQHRGGISETDRCLDLDGPGNQGGSKSKADDALHRDRLSGNVARIIRSMTYKRLTIFSAMYGGADCSTTRTDVALLGQTVDRKKWTMEPQTVNAVNLPLQNALSFPAAILQPPFFDPQAPDASELRRDRDGHRTRNQSHVRYRRKRV